MPYPSENEIPAGAVTGTTGSDGNPTFTLAHVPVDITQLKLYVGGQRRTLGLHFTIIGAAITCLAPYIPVVGESVIADYWFLV